MNHIIITLPKSLWNSISNGSKAYELRKVLPFFTPNKTRVYVVLKGTRYVIGYFTVSQAIACYDTERLWSQYGKYLAISKEWFLQYVSSKKRVLYLWQIRNVYQYNCLVDLEKYFQIKRNPQSFIYTLNEPYVRQTLVYNYSI